MLDIQKVNRFLNTVDDAIDCLRMFEINIIDPIWKHVYVNKHRFHNSKFDWKQTRKQSEYTLMDTINEVFDNMAFIIDCVDEHITLLPKELITHEMLYHVDCFKNRYNEILKKFAKHKEEGVSNGKIMEYIDQSRISLNGIQFISEKVLAAINDDNIIDYNDIIDDCFSDETKFVRLWNRTMFMNPAKAVNTNYEYNDVKYRYCFNPINLKHYIHCVDYNRVVVFNSIPEFYREMIIIYNGKENTTKMFSPYIPKYSEPVEVNGKVNHNEYFIWYRDIKTGINYIASYRDYEFGEVVDAKTDKSIHVSRYVEEYNNRYMNEYVVVLDEENGQYYLSSSINPPRFIKIDNIPMTTYEANEIYNQSM